MLAPKIIYSRGYFFCVLTQWFSFQDQLISCSLTGATCLRTFAPRQISACNILFMEGPSQLSHPQCDPDKETSFVRHVFIPEWPNTIHKTNGRIFWHRWIHLGYPWVAKHGSTTETLAATGVDFLVPTLLCAI